MVGVLVHVERQDRLSACEHGCVIHRPLIDEPTGAVTTDIVNLYLLGLPALLGGLWLGFKLYGKLDDAAFRKRCCCSCSSLG
jgi:hypothetical protein